MKRLISTIVLVAMLLASFSMIVPAFATEVSGTSTQVTKTYNVNWKELVDGEIMRATWIGNRNAKYNNMSSKYNIFATETSLKLTPKGGDNRAYFSEIMFDITDETQYEYVFMADKTNDDCADAGVVFAWAPNPNAYIRNNDHFADGENDIYPGVPKAVYHLMANWGAKTNYKVHYGGPQDEYAIFGTQSKTHLYDVKVDAEGFATYKVVYNGFNIKLYFLNTYDEWVEFFGDKNMTLVEGSKVALGLTVWSPSHTNLKNCVLYAMNDVSAEMMTQSTINYYITKAESVLSDGKDYSPISRAELEEALANAKSVLANSNATDAEMDEAASVLAAKLAAIKHAANKTMLRNVIDIANATIEGYTSADFEERYWTQFKTALDFAVELNNDTEADQDDVDYAAEELSRALKYLTYAGEACFVDLDETLTKYYALVETDYTPRTWANLATPYANAEALIARADITSEDQDEIDEATIALDNAIYALVYRANFNALNAIINRAEGLDKTDYTADSWKIDAVLEAAKAAAANLNNSQSVIDEATNALNDAINALVTWRTNVLAIVPADDYQVVDTEKYPNPTWYNKITDMSYNGFGNVFYYDYHKLVATEAAQGFESGKQFPQPLDRLYLQGSGDYTIRLGSNVSGSGSNRVTDGVKEGGTNLEHRAAPLYINGKLYGHAFGFSFLKAPTVDSVAVYLPTDTKIVSIDVYGAVLTKDAAGNTLYGKADKAAITSDAYGVQCEDTTTTKKIYLGTINVPAAEAGAANILATGDFVQAMKVDYIYFALTMAEGTGKNAYYKIKEIELYGLNDGETINGKTAPDFTAVNSAMDEFYSLIKSDYTEYSFANVESVIAQYANVINNIKATQTAVNIAADAIQTALNELCAKPADLTELDEAIALGATFAEEDYTPNTYVPFAQIFQKAIALRATTNIAQTVVDNMADELNAVINSLVLRANKTALKANLDAAKLLKEEEWNGNKIAWKMFANSIVAAEELMVDLNATQEDVDKVANDLISRKADLVKVEAPVDPEPEPEPEPDPDPDPDPDVENLEKIKMEMIMALGPNKDNSQNMYTQSSYNEYIKAYETIILSINNASTAEELEAINVEDEKLKAEAKLVLVTEELAALKNAALKILGEKIENIANKFTSASYSDYIFAYYSIISRINNAQDIITIKAIDVAALKALAEAKLQEVLPEIKETESKETVATDAPETEKATEPENNNNNGGYVEVPSDEKDSGCSSAVGISALAVIGVIGAAVLVKKKED